MRFVQQNSGNRIVILRKKHYLTRTFLITSFSNIESILLSRLQATRRWIRLTTEHATDLPYERFVYWNSTYTSSERATGPPKSPSLLEFIVFLFFSPFCLMYVLNSSSAGFFSSGILKFCILKNHCPKSENLSVWQEIIKNCDDWLCILMHRYKELPKITVFFLLISIVTGALVTGKSAYSKGKLQHRIGG